MQKNNEAEQAALRDAGARYEARMPDITPADYPMTPPHRAEELARAAQAAGLLPVHRMRDAMHPNTGSVSDYPDVPLPKRSLPVSKKTGMPVRRTAVHETHGLPQWYERATQIETLTPADFVQWRKNYVQLTVDECARLFRVSVAAVKRWERGTTQIPFAVWYVMHSYLQAPDVWVSRCGFSDLYVEYDDGEAFLCSAEWPDIRYSHGQLVCLSQAVNRMHSMDCDIQKLSARVRELENENTGLRQMFKENAITQELQGMHERLSSLLAQVNTADLYSLAERRDKQEKARVAA
jgi:hypothetical protein